MVFQPAKTRINAISQNPNYSAEAMRARDVWALGCVLLEVLTGEPPFPSDQTVAVPFLLAVHRRCVWQ